MGGSCILIERKRSNWFCPFLYKDQNDIVSHILEVGMTSSNLKMLNGWS